MTTMITKIIESSLENVLMLVEIFVVVVVVVDDGGGISISFSILFLFLLLMLLLLLLFIWQLIQTAWTPEMFVRNAWARLSLNASNVGNTSTLVCVCVRKFACASTRLQVTLRARERAASMNYYYNSLVDALLLLLLLFCFVTQCNAHFNWYFSRIPAFFSPIAFIYKHFIDKIISIFA